MYLFVVAFVLLLFWHCCFAFCIVCFLYWCFMCFIFVSLNCCLPFSLSFSSGTSPGWPPGGAAAPPEGPAEEGKTTRITKQEKLLTKKQTQKQINIM